MGETGEGELVQQPFAKGGREGSNGEGCEQREGKKDERTEKKGGKLRLSPYKEENRQVNQRPFVTGALVNPDTDTISLYAQSKSRAKIRRRQKRQSVQPETLQKTRFSK